MKKSKWLAVLTAGVLATAASTIPVSLTAKADTADGEAIKIMCLGDSITDGYFGADGYRKYLYHELTELGYNIDMVGAKSGGNSYTDNGETFTYDGDHSGYSGYAIQYITGTETRQGILETIESTDMINMCDPDIVLLQIGTNDILSAYNDEIEVRLENLVRTIMADMTDENDVLFLTTIPYFNAVTINDWLWAYGDVKWQNSSEDFADIVYDYIDTYNASIKTLVGELQAEGLSVEYADICSVVDRDTELQDGCHPNEAGYKDMGLCWAGILNSYLSSEKPVVTTTSTTAITTSTTTLTSTETTTCLTTTETVPSTTALTSTETTTCLTTTETISSTTALTSTETTTCPTTTETIPSTTSLTSTETITYSTTTETTTTKATAYITTSETTTTQATTTTKNYIPEQTTAKPSNTTEAVATTTTNVLTDDVTPEVNKGDVNGDNVISMVDVVKIRKYILNMITKDELNLEAADMDSNGTVNIMDAVRLLMYIIEAR